mgnify:FL=1
MAKIIISEAQFKNLCRSMLKESRREDYAKSIIRESLEKAAGKNKVNNEGTQANIE